MRPTLSNTKTPHAVTGLFALLGGVAHKLGAAATLALLFAALPATASAYAHIEAPPIYSTAPGLPDGRVYEQVSPADKSGNEAGASSSAFTKIPGTWRYAQAGAEGDSILFEGTGPMGETADAYDPYFVATRSSSGWHTKGLLPPAQGRAAEIGTLNGKPTYLDPSSDLSHVMFVSGRAVYSEPPYPQVCDAELLDFSSSGSFAPATWLTRAQASGALESCAPENGSVTPVGGTPSFSTVYFAYAGTILPEDAARQQGEIQRGQEVLTAESSAWGYYEDREGTVREAGVLPDGSLDPFGAVPAASGHGRPGPGAGNEVSADGSRALFVSPDPASCSILDGGENNCALDPPELYVRENGEKTLLVSKDTLLATVDGLPSGAPDGVLPTRNPTYQVGHYLRIFGGSYVFASSDGSQAFFQSEDRLTNEAPEGPPGNTSPKAYDFNVNTGELTYLPGVEGRILAAAADGSVFAFERPEADGGPGELDLWSSGPGGGTVNSIAQLPIGAAPQGLVPEARMTPDGSVLVFVTSADVPGGFNSGGFRQVYRYDTIADTLGCVSCAPVGVTPTGDAQISQLAAIEDEENGSGGPAIIPGTVENRGISTNGDRVFFDTPDPLVPQDTNANTFGLLNGEEVKQGRDVYEWENGEVYLISTGKGPRNSYFLDNSENGDDLFFATTDSLVPGDTDAGYDIYDARVPHPGDNQPPAAVPCDGSVCQGPANVPTPLGAPASATFAGLGDLTPESVSNSTAISKPKPKVARCRKGYVRKKGKCVKNKAKHSSRRVK